jgi:hypothetical protein
MHDVFLPVADFGSEPDTGRNPPLPHNHLRSLLKHTRVMGSVFFWRIHTHAMCETVDDHPIYTLLNLFLYLIFRSSLQNLNEPPNS